MPSNTPSKNEKRLNKAVSVWRSLRPAKKFLGLTVDEFEAELKPCHDCRKDVAKAEAKLTGTVNARNAADADGLALVDRLVAAVKADETEGENSEVLEALGYVIPAKRKSGLHRKSDRNDVSKAA